MGQRSDAYNLRSALVLVKTHELHPAASHEASDQVYNGLDACITLEVHEELSRLSNREPECYNFERALQAPLLEMMLRGFRIDEFERRSRLECSAKVSLKLTARCRPSRVRCGIASLTRGRIPSL